jgi:anaerobic selenocysteine-containing dehydrogenase
VTLRTSYATCSLCDAICGIAVEHDGDRIVSIKGDRDDPFSKGHVCPKVMGLKHIHEDPDRVRAPLKRGVSGEFHEVTWDEALDEASERLARVQRAHGNDAVALYIGNPTAHSYSASLMVPLFLRAMATRNAFSATSMDSLPRLLASQLVYGSPLVIPVPDLDRTSLLIVLGANPVVSNGSMMTAPGVKKRLLAIKERGGRVVVIDPRRTETA